LSGFFGGHFSAESNRNWAVEQLFTRKYVEMMASTTRKCHHLTYLTV